MEETTLKDFSDNPRERYDHLDEDYRRYPKVRKNPLNRKTAFAISGHTDYSSERAQSALVTALARIRDEYSDHVLIVGGDEGERGGKTKHYIIRYDGSAGDYGEYEITKHCSHTGRKTFSEAGKVKLAIDDHWADDSFTYVGLLHEEQSEFTNPDVENSKSTDKQSKEVSRKWLSYSNTYNVV